MAGRTVTRYYGASVDDGRENLGYDLYYLKNHSLVLERDIFYARCGWCWRGSVSHPVINGSSRSTRGMASVCRRRSRRSTVGPAVSRLMRRRGSLWNGLPPLLTALKMVRLSPLNKTVGKLAAGHGAK